MGELRAMDHAQWMRRCLQLALNGAGHAAPNPMVGAVLVQGDRILAEGWHHAHGGAHAEVECLKAFGDGPVPHDAVMYVSLEPCSHTGLTPPCADLLVARKVPAVVIGNADPNPKVAGRGITRLREAGIEVTTGVLEDECRWVNRRFITSMELGRPYIVLKWARSSDGFLDQRPRSGRSVQRISCFTTDVLVHRWRSEEQAILAGSRTVLNDDPRLDVRHVTGRAPLRVILDRQGITPAQSQVYDGSSPTLLFTAKQRADLTVEQVLPDPAADPLPTMLQILHERQIRSVLVEGGAELLSYFLRAGLWDEAREIVGRPVLGNGTRAPHLSSAPARSMVSGDDIIHFHLRTGSGAAAWPWP